MKLDSELRDWVLLPITIIMVLVELIRHSITELMNTIPTKTLLTHREEQALIYLKTFARLGPLLPPNSFESRRQYLITQLEEKKYLKDPNATARVNPMLSDDPQQMQMMMEMMKKNMTNLIPQTIMMGWISMFFSGFVTVKLPFPLTVRFKSMLQRGIEAEDMDVRWVSSLSWYFLNLFGWRNLFTLIIGSGQDISAMVGMPQTQAGPVDVNKLFEHEKENLSLLRMSDWWLDNVEDRIIKLLE